MLHSYQNKYQYKYPVDFCKIKIFIHALLVCELT